jgi:6-phosphogluconolactonase
MDIFIGTYTRSTSRGIYRVSFDTATGELGSPRVAAELGSPTWLTWTQDRRMLLAVDAGGEGGVTAFGLDRANRELTRLGTQATGGGSPCHLAATADGRLALAASYARGVVTVFPLSPDAGLAPRRARFAHQGHGPHERQGSAHAHGVTLSPDERFLFVPDLGADQIFAYRLDVRTGEIARHPPSDWRAAPGAGPRHLSFAPGGRHAYLINELESTVVAFAYDPAGGLLQALETLPTLPADSAGANTTAEIAVHPAGHSVYGSNRGHDSIVHYRRNIATGRLTLVGHTFSGGRHPRHFALSPRGDWLIAAHEASDNLTVLAVDPADGRLTPTASTAKVPMPVCVLFDA